MTGWEHINEKPFIHQGRASKSIIDNRPLRSEDEWLNDLSKTRPCAGCRYYEKREDGTLYCIAFRKIVQLARNLVGPCEQYKSKEDNMQNSTEAVNHPSHYNQGKIEVIEFIEDQKMNYHLGNALKYICRAGAKDPSKTIEDLRKAVWYINRYIETFKQDPKRPNDMESV